MFASGRFSSSRMPGGGRASSRMPGGGRASSSTAPPPPPQSDKNITTQTQITLPHQQTQTQPSTQSSSINLAERLCWVPLPNSNKNDNDTTVPPLLWPAIIYQSHSEFLSCRSANLSGLEKQQLSAQLLQFSLNHHHSTTTGRVCQLLCRSNTINSILVVADETYFEFVDVVGAQLQHYACQPSKFTDAQEYLSYHQALDESMQLLGYQSSSSSSTDNWVYKAQAALSSTSTSNQVQVQASSNQEQPLVAKSPTARRPPAPAMAQQAHHPAGAPSPNDQPSIAAVSLGSTIATNESSLPHHHSSAGSSRMPPPPPSLQLDKYASWTDTWSELLFQGWQMYQSTEGGTGSMVYSAPNGLSFRSLEQVQTYVTNAYGWVGPHRKKRSVSKQVYTPTTQSFYHFGVLWKQTLEPLGWTMVKAPPSYHCDWLYLKPQVTVTTLDNCTQGVDFFTQDFQVVQYCQQQQYHLNYHPKSSKKKSASTPAAPAAPLTPVETPLQDQDHDDNATTMTTPQGQATVPQDPAQPQLEDSDDESDSEEPPLSVDEYYNFNNHLWPLLQSRGYTWDHGSGLIDRYYFRPGCSKKFLGSYTEGVEYWISQQDLIECERKKDELAQVGPFAKKFQKTKRKTSKTSKTKAAASSKPKANLNHKRRSSTAATATVTSTPAPAPKRRTKKPAAKLMVDSPPAPEEEDTDMMVDEATTTPAPAKDDATELSAPDSESSLVSKDTYYAWNNVKLRHFSSSSGGDAWFYMKSPNPLQDYWYVRPGRSKAQRHEWNEGVDYFTSQDDVVDFLKQQDEAQAEQANTRLPYRTKKTSQSQNKRKQNHGPTQARKAARRSKQEQKERNKEDTSSEMEIEEQEQEPAKSTKKPTAVVVAKQTKTSRAKGAAVDAPLVVDDPNDNDAPWVTLEIPNSGWPLLKKVGCTYGPGSQYKFTDQDNGTVLWQGDMIELPHFLATQGVPNAHRLSKDELEQLTLWVNFDPLPISIYDTGRGKKIKIVYSHMVRELQTQEVELYLRRLGFTKTKAGTGWKAPEQASASLHVTEFEDLEHVRQVLRSVRDLEAACRGTTTQGRRRSSHKFPPLLQPVEMLALRLWIAMTPAPLPVYGTNTASTGASGATSTKTAPASSKKAAATKQTSSSNSPTTAQTASVAVETPLDSKQNQKKKSSTSSSKANKASASMRSSSKKNKSKMLSKKTTTTPLKKTSHAPALSAASSPGDCSHRSDSNRSMASIMSQADVSREELLQLEARQSHWQWAWKLLQKLGCYWASGDYRLPRGFTTSVKSNAGFASVDDLVRYCCQYGIPNLNTSTTVLTPKEASDLMEYVQFINVDFGLALTQGVKIDLGLDDASAWYILTLLGFELMEQDDTQQEDSKYVLPGVRALGLPQAEWIHGVHYVQGQNELVNLVRSTKDLVALPNAFVMGRSSRRRKQNNEVSTSCRAKNHQLLALRIWAAKHDEPLPIHPTLQELQKSNNDTTTDQKDEENDYSDDEGDNDEGDHRDEHDNDVPEEDEPGSDNHGANDEPEEEDQEDSSRRPKEHDDDHVPSNDNTAMKQDSDDEAPEQEADDDDDDSSSKGQQVVASSHHSSSPSTSGLIGLIKEQQSTCNSSARSVGSTSVRTRRSTSSHESFHTPAQTLEPEPPIEQPDNENDMTEEEEQGEVQAESPLNDEVVRLLTQEDTMQLLTQAAEEDDDDDMDDYPAQPKNLSFDTPRDENHLEEGEEYEDSYNQDVDRFVPMTQPEEPDNDDDNDGDDSSDASSMASMMHNLPSNRATPSASSIRTATRSQTKTPASRTRSHHAPPSSALSL